MPSRSSASAAAHARWSSEPVADEDELRGAARGLAQDVAAARHALAGEAIRAGQGRELLAGQRERDRSAGVLDRERPGRGRLVRVARPDERQVRDRAERRVVLDRLVGRPVLAEPDRVVGPDVDEVQPRQGGQPDRAAHVVAERQERRAVGDEPAVIGDAVGRAAHPVLADPEAEVAPGLVGAEVRLALDVGQVRLRQVGRAAEELGEPRRQRLDRVLARVARRDLGPGLVGLEVGVPVRRAAPGRSGAGTRARRPGRPRRRPRVAPPTRRPSPRRRGSRHGTGRARRPARRTSGPGPSRRPPSSGGPRRGRAASRAPSGCRACSGCRSRCASGRR